MRRTTLLLMLSLVFGLTLSLCVTPLPAAEVEVSAGTCDRSQIDLTGEWLFQADREDAGVKASFFAADFDASGWRHVGVPISFDRCGVDMERYQGAGWFRRTVYVASKMRGRRVVLHFEGVNYNASVWVNGKHIGDNEDAFLPFDLPVTDVLRYGQNNLIVVRVDNIRNRPKCQFPLFEGWFGQGGFLREASLVATDLVYIDYVRITAEPEGATGKFLLQVTLANSAAELATGSIQVEIRNAAGKKIARFVSGNLGLAGGAKCLLQVEGNIDDITAWSPDLPALYTARVHLLGGDEQIDSMTTRFGFRRVEAKQGQVLLNGKPIFLMGFNRHEDSPARGMAVDLEQVRADLLDMKSIGANYVRLCHYPHHPGELDLCDELGMLVMIENAMNEWGHGSFVPTPEEAPVVVANGKRTLEKMIRRDVNHPSVILCSVGNESAEERADVMAGNSELIEYGKKFDPTRLWAHVSNSYRKGEYTPAFYQSDDVLAVNAYPVHWLSPGQDEFEKGFPAATAWLQDQFAKLHRDFPDKPIVIGECGWPMQGNDEWQSRTVVAEFKTTSAPYVAGVSFWCYAHHPWPPEIGPMSSYGYVSRDRQTRYKAFYTIENLFKEKTRQWNSQTGCGSTAATR